MGRMKDLLIPDELDYDNYVEYPEGPVQLVFPEFVEWWIEEQFTKLNEGLWKNPQWLAHFEQETNDG